MVERSTTLHAHTQRPLCLDMDISRRCTLTAGFSGDSAAHGGERGEVMSPARASRADNRDLSVIIAEHVGQQCQVVDTPALRNLQQCCARVRMLRLE